MAEEAAGAEESAGAEEPAAEAPAQAREKAPELGRVAEEAEWVAPTVRAKEAPAIPRAPAPAGSRGSRYRSRTCQSLRGLRRGGGRVRSL